MHRIPVALVVVMASTVGTFTAHAADPPVRQRPTAVTVKLDPLSPTAGIQEAIDALGTGGGVVTVPPGEYLVRQSIHVRSDVTLQGSGDRTVLRKSKQLGSKLGAQADSESRSLRVRSAAGFREGDEIGIYDGTTVGWLHSHAIVKGVRGDELLLNRRVGRAFDPANGAAVINYFPAISGRDVSKVVLKSHPPSQGDV